MPVILGKSGVNKECKEIYLGNGGINKKEKEIYLGKSGVNKQVYKASILPYTLTNATSPNSYTLTEDVSPNYITFKKSNTISFSVAFNYLDDGTGVHNWNLTAFIYNVNGEKINSLSVDISRSGFNIGLITSKIDFSVINKLTLSYTVSTTAKSFEEIINYKPIINNFKFGEGSAKFNYIKLFN